MKWPRRSILIAAAALLLVGLCLMAARSFRATSSRSDWLIVSSLIFGSHTNFGQAFPTVALTISNAGPRLLEYGVHWLECRAGSNYALLATNYGFQAWSPLPSGAVIVLTRDLVESPSWAGDRLFCCQISWGESEPEYWRFGRRLEPWVSQVMGIFDSQWVPPWVSQSRHRARGDVFTSNISVADYFRLVYGWTRSDWLETLARLEAEKTQAVAFRQRYGLAPALMLAQEDRLRAEARGAFATFCQNSTNESGPAR